MSVKLLLLAVTCIIQSFDPGDSSGSKDQFSVSIQEIVAGEIISLQGAYNLRPFTALGKIQWAKEKEGNEEVICEDLSFKKLGKKFGEGQS